MRTPTPVDKDKLIAAIAKAEENGALENLSALYQSAAAIYNSSVAEKHISYSVVMARIEEWAITTLTVKGAKGRKVGSGLKPVRDPKDEKPISEEPVEQEKPAKPELAKKATVYNYAPTKEEEATDRLSLDAVRAACKDISNVISGENVILNCVIVVKDTPYAHLPKHSVFHKVILMPVEDKIEIWVLREDGPPDYRITGAFTKAVS